MKVLIVTYYWPPAGGSGVQRWLKFVKYLRDFNIEPVVYTVQDPKYAIEDEALQKDIPEGIEIIRTPIWEPNNVISIFGKKNKKTSAGFLNPNPSFFGKLAQYIRANFFIPDARKFWIKPSVKKLSAYITSNNIQVVISTGPPHSLHLIGLQLKQKLDLKWIADFRDPWTDIDYFHQLPLTMRAKNKHKLLEQKVVEGADTVIVVGKTMKANFSKFNTNVQVITNGYDKTDKTQKVILDTHFSLVHIGLMNADRNHKALWEALNQLCEENDNFRTDLRLKFIGAVATEVKNSIAKFKLNENATFIDYVPHHEVANYQRSAQVLLLSINNVPSAKGIITGKIFEYLQADRPILGIAPIDGDLAEIINTTKTGVVVGFDDIIQLKESIQKMYGQFKQDKLTIEGRNIERYHRRALTNELANVVKELVL